MEHDWIYKEPGSEDIAYCRGDNQIIGKDQEEIAGIIANGVRTGETYYTIAKKILNMGYEKLNPDQILDKETIKELMEIIRKTNRRLRDLNVS